MASEAAHLLKAASNQKFLDVIPDEHAEWLLIVAFYKAVHLVESMFALSAVHSRNHEERNSRLRKQFVPIWREYKPLFDISVMVRYNPRSLSASQVRSEYLSKRLLAVERLIEVQKKTLAPIVSPTERSPNLAQQGPTSLRAKSTP